MDSLKAKMTSLTPFSRKHKVCVVGSGNWGSTIAKLVGENTAAHPELFEKDVQMWVYEETVQLDKTSKLFNSSSEWSTAPQKLTDLINHFHENVKYLPGIALPPNVVANPSVTDAVKDSTILIFNLPHQFIEGICSQLRGHILPYARGISCIKGVNVKESSISLFSETIGRELDIYCGALSGANIANEVAQEKFSETTIAYDPPLIDSQAPTPAASAGPSPSSSHVDLTKITHKDVSGKISKAKLKPLPAEYQTIDHRMLKTLFHRRYFHVRVVSDVAGVSLGGALKNIIAVAAGWVDGLGWGDNAKAAVMRVGLLEMVDFGKRFFSKTVHTGTFTEESAGVADLITTCAGGRNHRCAKMSIQEGKSIEEIEARELNGQKLQGTLTAIEVNTFLKSQGLEKQYPLFTAVYNVLKGHAKVEDLPDLIEPNDESNSTTVNERESFVPGNVDGIDKQPSDSASTTRSSEQEARSSFVSSRQEADGGKPSAFVAAPALASSRYHRQLLIPKISIRGQSLLSRTKVLVVGLGGLGCPAALYLAGAGVCTLGLVDADTVELSNLHRQILHREATVGWSKVASAARGLKEVNSDIKYVEHHERLSAQNALEVMKGYDVILDCTDNPATRYLISDACVILDKPLISGAAQRTEGQLMLLNYPVGKGPCYRCVFPKAPAPETVLGCSEIGVLGPVVGVIGVLMAAEAVKMIVARSVGEKEAFNPCLLLYNAFARETRSMFRGIALRPRRKNCVACDEDVDMEQRITEQRFREGMVDYEAFCGRLQDVTILGDERRMGASEFLNLMTEERPQKQIPIVVDVREENEVELGPRIRGSINIPISRILRQAGPLEGRSVFADFLQEPANETQGRSVFFVCQRGNDSQVAAQRFTDAQAAGEGGLLGWVGDVKGGFVAIEKEAMIHS